MKKRLVLLILIICLSLLCSCGEKPSVEPNPLPATDDIVDPKPIPEPNLEDDEYLILANKTHALEKDYWPEDLVTIDRFVAGVGNADTHMLREKAAEALNKMLDAASEAGYEIRLRTGFRSYDYQAALYNSYVEKNGQAAADTYSARPGYSEHQTGLACDLGCKSQDFALSYQFGDTDKGKWVAEHAHEFGFVIRYIDGKTDANGVRRPGEITGYVFEPWHIRFVGIDHATKMFEQQITLEEYLDKVDDARYKD